MGEVLKGKCPTMKQGNIIKTGIENHQTILLKNASYLKIQRITSVIKQTQLGFIEKKNIDICFHSK